MRGVETKTGWVEFIEEGEQSGHYKIQGYEDGEDDDNGDNDEYNENDDDSEDDEDGENVVGKDGQDVY